MNKFDKKIFFKLILNYQMYFFIYFEIYYFMYNFLLFKISIPTLKFTNFFFF